MDEEIVILSSGSENDSGNSSPSSPHAHRPKSPKTVLHQTGPESSYVPESSSEPISSPEQESESSADSEQKSSPLASPEVPPPTHPEDEFDGLINQYGPSFLAGDTGEIVRVMKGLARTFSCFSELIVEHIVAGNEEREDLKEEVEGLKEQVKKLKRDAGDYKF